MCGGPFAFDARHVVVPLGVRRGNDAISLPVQDSPFLAFDSTAWSYVSFGQGSWH